MTCLYAFYESDVNIPILTCLNMLKLKYVSGNRDFITITLCIYIVYEKELRQSLNTLRLIVCTSQNIGFVRYSLRTSEKPQLLWNHS